MLFSGKFCAEKCLTVALKFYTIEVNTNQNVLQIYSVSLHRPINNKNKSPIK